MRKIGAALLLAVLFGGALRAEPLRVFAAASLGGALDEAAALWQEQGGVPVLTVYASSALLARQIAAGAPADIFISANVDWMDFLEDQGLLAPDTRLDLLGNELVLIGPAAGQ
ncbi:MAG: molybdate ABC transporter substrate-binding protein, partial [Rhodobacteraceae bacterium]|nr:molybdate ABC transporter substrate-binding protein [Paracoccaceae bacterium]